MTTSSTLPTLPTLCPVSRMGAVTGQPTFSSLNKLEAISHVLVLSAHHWAGPKHRTKKKRKRNSRPLSSGHRCKFSHVPCLCVCVCVCTQEKKLTISIPLGMCVPCTHTICAFVSFSSLSLPQSPVAATSREKVTKAWQPSDRMNSIKTGVCREPLLLIYRRWQSHPKKKKYRNSHII